MKTKRSLIQQLIPSLPVPQAFARIAALEEAADHLDLDWTDMPLERADGKALSEILRSAADEVYKRSKTK